LCKAPAFDIKLFECLEDIDIERWSAGGIYQINVGLIPVFQQFMKYLREYISISKSSSANNGDEMCEDYLCSICYAAEIDTKFEPCHHSSCHMCISRQLLNFEKCFFCNAKVISLQKFNPRDEPPQ